MDAVVRATVIYLFLLLLFRLIGNRPLAQVTVFDLVLLLIIGESTQQALIGDNFSITNALVLITTLLTLEALFTIFTRRSRVFDRIVDGAPVVVIDKGRMLHGRMHECGLNESDLMEAARTQRGLERLEQVKFAVVERDGTVSIIPHDPNAAS